MWGTHVRSLLPTFHCLRPTLPGHPGASTPLFELDTAVAEVAAHIRTQAVAGRAHVVGLSLGGQVALALAARHPELVDKLVVSGVNVHGLPGAAFARPVAAVVAGAYRLPVLRAWREKRLGVAAAERAEFRRLAAPTTDQLTAILTESAGFRLPDRLRGYPGPVLILCGQREPALIHRSARTLAAALGDATIRTIPAARHPWPLTQPDLFAQVVRDVCREPTEHDANMR
jgi:pimeloyl-ACP methyl ester carboxylesterase